MKSLKFVKFGKIRASYTSPKIIKGELKNTVLIIIKFFIMIVAFATITGLTFFFIQI